MKKTSEITYANLRERTRDQNVPIAGGRGVNTSPRIASFRSEQYTEGIFTASGSEFCLQIIPGADHRLDTIDAEKSARFFGLLNDGSSTLTAELVRCPWAVKEPARTYHDSEWGVPVHDDVRLFELLTLEGAQAGLSWDTVLRKREGYRRIFCGFDPMAVAALDNAAIDAAVLDAGIIRHRGKIRSTVTNAAAFLDVRREFGSFATYLWAFVDGKPQISRYTMDDDPPTTTALSDRVSHDLRKRSFAFVGSTIVQSFLQACGVRNDHRTTCFRAAP